MMRCIINMVTGITKVLGILILLLTGVEGTIAQERILLPVEVLGVDQTTESRTFTIAYAAQAKWLYMRINNFSVEGKVEVSFNNSINWTSIANDNVDIPEPDKGFGGIGGGYSTIRLCLDVSGESLVDGSNTVSFRFNAANDAISVGYRVINFNVLDGAKNELINDALFSDDDPTAWTAPFSDANSISEGETLWRTAALVDPSGAINARCMDCHAQDGRDMKYFNYSNKSIVERSIYHGLTALEGEKIASYIRQLDTPAPVTARPWNPPYQPGPDLDSKPQEEWAAGAGLDAVLNSDADMLDYMFPNGTSEEELSKVIDLKGTMNIREMPIAIQFPDWKHWLPRVHPKDMMSDAAYQEVISGVGYNNRVAGTYGYKVVRADLEANGVSSYNNNTEQLMDKMANIGAGVQDFLIKDQTQNSGNFWWTTQVSYGINKNTSNLTTEHFKENLAQWNAVKHWELMQEFQIESTMPVNEDFAEHVQWPLNNWTVFAIAPHIVGDRRGRSRFEDQAQEVGYYFSTAWYQLQMVLNGGMRKPQGVAPVDWSYNFDHVLKSGFYTGYLEPLRLFQNIIKSYQQRDNPHRANRNDWVNNSAWNMREVSPWRLYSSASGNQTLHEELDNYEDGLREKLTSQLLTIFMEKVNSIDKSDWPRETDSWYALEPETHIPRVNSTGSCLFPNENGGCTDIQNAVEANAIYTVIPLFQELGVACDAVENLRVWSADMWPRGDWEKYIQPTCSGDFIVGVEMKIEDNGNLIHEFGETNALVMSELERRDGLNIYATTDDAVKSVIMELSDITGIVRSFTGNTAPYALFDNGDGYVNWTLTPGDYTLNVKAYGEIDATGEVLTEEIYTLSVDKGSYIYGLELLAQSSGQQVTLLEEGEVYNIYNFPDDLLDIGLRSVDNTHIHSVRFDMNDGGYTYLDTQAPFSMYGGEVDWSPEAGRHGVKVSVFGDSEGLNDLIEEKMVTFELIDEEVLAIENNASMTSNRVYPNPVKTYLNLPNGGNWEIYNLQGKKLAAGFSDVINVMDIEPGLYLLRLKNDVQKFRKI